MVSGPLSNSHGTPLAAAQLDSVLESRLDWLAALAPVGSTVMVASGHGEWGSRASRAVASLVYRVAKRTLLLERRWQTPGLARRRQESHWQQMGQ
uniref:Uncharacterized protein n=1 Tax=Plectus sambesii TaxID=2011161 RepID=A0A914VUX3_9BILA